MPAAKDQRKIEIAAQVQWVLAENSLAMAEGMTPGARINVSMGSCMRSVVHPQAVVVVVPTEQKAGQKSRRGPAWTMASHD